MLTLQPITKENWFEAILLKVREDQRGFVATNAVSLAQLNFLTNFCAKAIYDEDAMVGFTLYGIAEEDKQYWIYRLMIDEKYQGKGYGKNAIQLIIKDIQSKKLSHHDCIYLSYEPENVHAKRVYTNAGFTEVEGFMVGGEQVSKYIFR